MAKDLLCGVAGLCCSPLFFISLSDGAYQMTIRAYVSFSYVLNFLFCFVFVLFLFLFVCFCFCVCVFRYHYAYDGVSDAFILV
jgi:hypothetical protein